MNLEQLKDLNTFTQLVKQHRKLFIIMLLLFVLFLSYTGCTKGWG